MYRRTIDRVSIIHVTWRMAPLIYPLQTVKAHYASYAEDHAFIDRKNIILTVACLIALVRPAHHAS